MNNDTIHIPGYSPIILPRIDAALLYFQIIRLQEKGCRNAEIAKFLRLKNSSIVMHRIYNMRKRFNVEKLGN